MIKLGRVTCATLALVAAVALAGGAAAQPATFPSGPIKLIVPFSAGGSSDILGRAFAQKVGADLGQTIVVDNRSGGNTVIGTQAAATSKPDGYTVLQVTPNAAVVAALQPNPVYDLERDFVPVLGVGSVPLLLAVPGKSAIRSIADLVAAAKSTPQGINYASGGIGSLGHLAAARFAHELKFSATHVPFRGVAQAIQEVMANRIQLMFVSGLEGMQLAKSGEIRVLAVTSEQRLPGLPDVPTMAESGFADFTPAVWYGFIVPAKTPSAIVDRLASAFSKAANDRDVQARLRELGLTTRIRSGPDFGKFMREETTRWRRVIAENNIKME